MKVTSDEFSTLTRAFSAIVSLRGLKTRPSIVPVATAADGRNYFEVEATPDEQQANLRPGLTGVAKIEVGSRSLAWLLFHRAADWLRLALWTVML